MRTSGFLANAALAMLTLIGLSTVARSADPGEPFPGLPPERRITSCQSLDPSEGGTYVLAANLIAGSGRDCIVLRRGGITIDLNGFSITGVAIAFNDTQPGRKAITSDRPIHNINIRNGSISAFIDGIDLRTSSEVSVENIRFTNMGRRGQGGNPLIVGKAGTVTGNTISNSFAKTSIETGDASFITRNTIQDNSGIAIFMGKACTVTDNRILNVSEDGINSGGWSNQITNNIILDVADLGIRSGSNSMIADNTVMGREGSVGSGITAGQVSIITNNNVDRWDMGIVAERGSNVSGNTVSRTRIGILGAGYSRVVANIVTSCSLNGIQLSQFGAIAENNHVADVGNIYIHCAASSSLNGAKNNTLTGTGTLTSPITCRDLGGNIRL